MNRLKERREKYVGCYYTNCENLICARKCFSKKCSFLALNPESYFSSCNLDDEWFSMENRYAQSKYGLGSMPMLYKCG